MRQIIVTEMISVDGVIDSPGAGEHRDAGWTFNEVEFLVDAYSIKEREQKMSEAMLLGRQTYQEFAPVWPMMNDEFPRYNAMPKYVVSSTLPQTDEGTWEAPHVLRTMDDVAELKNGKGGPIIVHGSATLAQGLFAAGLVDRVHLLQYPLILGTGKKFFGETPKTKLNLVEQHTYENGMQRLVYIVPRTNF